MQRTLNRLTKMYTSLRNSPISLPRSTITTLKLNKHPLPKQPIPDLKKTAERYLRSVQPLLNEDEYKKTEKIVCEFISEKGPGPKLQQKLLERFQNTDNWMSAWWLRTAYLGYRAPVIVNSSPGNVGPPIDLKCPDDVYVYAARLVKAVCDYNDAVKSGKMKQEMARDTPLDMQPYGMILGSHRQPNKGVDKLLHTDDAKHIVILSNNHFFKLCLVNESGTLTESNLIAAMKDIADRSCVPGKPVGILTGNDRDTWAEDYNLLLGLGTNKDIVKDIETSLFVLCLDKAIPKLAFTCKNNASVRAVQSMTGYNSCTNGGNRWHDKTVQFIVSPDGFIGMEYEHSPCEGVPIAVLHDHVLNYISSKESSPTCESPKDFPRAELLKFEINEALDCAIQKAACVVDKISEDIDMECFKFDKFGADEIKKIKFSPDSFIQIAMQVTFYKLYKKPPAHYESAALRRYKNARTECIRSTSCESVEFGKIMSSNDPAVSKEKKKELMIKAINAHKKLAAEAVVAEGVDRHLYGLKLIAQSEGIDLPELYKDVGYTRSTYFNLTSSQRANLRKFLQTDTFGEPAISAVQCLERIIGKFDFLVCYQNVIDVPYKTASFMCYGPVVPEGYGCCYNPRPKDILFACSSFKTCKDTNSRNFANCLQQTLCDMKELGSI